MRNLHQTSNSHKVLHGISSQTLVTIVLGVVEIVSFSIMSRLLTKEDFGYYAAISAVVAIFACFSDAGIGSAIIQRKVLTQKYINNAFTLSLLFGGTASLVLLASSPFLAVAITDGSMTKSLMLMSLTLLLNCLTSVNMSQMYRKLQFLRAGMIGLASLVITSSVAIILAWYGYGYYAIITRAILSSVLLFLLSLIIVKPHYKLEFHNETCKEIFGFSGWLMASGLFRNLAHDVDKLLMSRLLSVSSLGAYNRPKDFIGQISTKLNGIFDSALFPVLSGIQDDKEKIKKAFLKSLYFMNVFAMLLTLVLAINSELIIRIFFGEQWMELKWVTFALSFLMLFNIDGRLADCFLRSLGMTRQQFIFRVIETIVTLIGVVVGALWGVLGVAIAVVLINALLKLCKILFIAYKIGTPYTQTTRVIICSWRFALPLISICGIVYLLIPSTLVGNICLLTLFITTTAVEFLFFPSMVGKQYTETTYKFVRDRVINIWNRKEDTYSR